MSSLLLETSHSPKDSIYTANEKQISLVFTFFFVLFFVQFGRKMLLNEPIDGNILTTTILIIIWYGLSVMSVDKLK